MGKRESFNDYEYLANNLPFGIMMVDSAKIIHNPNIKMTELFGDIDNQHIESTKISLFKPEIIDRVNEVFKTGADKSAIMAPIDKKSKASFQSINYYALKGNKGKTDAVLVVISDTGNTNQWQKEFNVLFENVPVYITIVDTEYKIVRANQRYRNTFGSTYSIFHNEVAKRKFESQANSTAFAFEDGEEHSDTIVISTSNREKAHVIVNSIPFTVKEGKVNLVMEICTDITEISKLQDQINNAHDFYTNLIESSNDGIMAIDIKGKIQIINSAAKKILGFEGNRKPSLARIKEIMPDEIFGEANDDGTICSNYDISLLNNVGESVPLRFNSYVIQNKRKIEGRVAFFQDLRKIKNLEQRINDAETMAFLSTIRALKPSVTTFLAKHKEMFAELNELITSEVKSKKALEKWQSMKVELEHLDRIIDGFICSVDESKPQLSEININNTLKDIYEDFKVFIEYNEINFSVNLNGFDILVQTDYSSFRRLLSLFMMYSLSNVKDLGADAKVSIHVMRKDGKVRVEIVDNGPEIMNFSTLMPPNFKESTDLKFGFFTVFKIAERLGLDIELKNDTVRGNVYSIISTE